MNKKIVIAFILMTVLAVTAYAQQYDPESDFRVEPFSDGGEVEIIEYLGNKKAVRIPPKIKNKPVTNIMSGAFSGKQLTSVTIPNSVWRIESGAFANNKLTSVIIPNGVESLSGFNNNQLTSVTIPNNVTGIWYGAFANNLLTSVTIPNSVTYLDGFANNQLTSITIPSSVGAIGRGSFANNKLTSVIIPDSVTSIEEKAFSGNPLISITIPSNVWIGEGAFTGDFVDVYYQNNRTGGTYRADANGNWRKT
jgi:hypothetical protein